MIRLRLLLGGRLAKLVESELEIRGAPLLYLLASILRAVVRSSATRSIGRVSLAGRGSPLCRRIHA